MKKFLVFIAALQCVTSQAQELVTTVGVQFKPMLQTKFIDRGGGVETSDWVQGEFRSAGGYSFGMVIRKGLSELVSVESGISYVKRNFEVELTDLELDYSGTTQFSFISYQIPAQALVYARLTEELWMNASVGAGINFFPSSTKSTYYDEILDVNFTQVGYRTGIPSWVGVSVLANYGFEYRTKKSGYFYLGASFDRPFNDVLLSRAVLERADGDRQTVDGLFSGSYLTIDFRYFFHEDPERKRRIKN